MLTVFVLTLDICISYMSVCCPSSAGYQSGLHKSRDVRECQPGVTTGESRMFQDLVVPDR